MSGVKVDMSHDTYTVTHDTCDRCSNMERILIKWRSFRELITDEFSLNVGEMMALK